MTLLHYTLASGFVPRPHDILQTILAYNIPPNALEVEGTIFLHFAAQSGVPVPVATLQILMAKGVDITAADLHGMTVLHHASVAGSIDADMISFLLENGVGLNTPDNHGRTALHHVKNARMRPKRPKNSVHYRKMSRADRWAKSEDILVEHGAIDLGQR
jgi:ankyrin repeat protein